MTYVRPHIRDGHHVRGYVRHQPTRAVGAAEGGGAGAGVIAVIVLILALGAHSTPSSTHPTTTSSPSSSVQHHAPAQTHEPRGRG